MKRIKNVFDKSIKYRTKLYQSKIDLNNFVIKHFAKATLSETSLFMNDLPDSFCIPLDSKQNYKFTNYNCQIWSDKKNVEYLGVKFFFEERINNEIIYFESYDAIPLIYIKSYVIQDYERFILNMKNKILIPNLIKKLDLELVKWLNGYQVLCKNLPERIKKLVSIS